MVAVVRGVFAVLLVTGSLVLLSVSSVSAAGVVGTGNAASCTEAALDAALAGGGLVTFNCGGAATIPLTSEKVIGANTQVNGGGQITLDGQGQTRIFYINEDVSLDLRRITLTGGNGVGAEDPGEGGAIYSDRGLVTVTDTIITDSAAAAEGGGIWASGGTLTVVQSTITDNTADEGGGIRTSAVTLTIIESTITGNTADDGGGIYTRASTALTITDSNISDNSALVSGGGLYTSSGAQTITESLISDNSAGDRGGGVYIIGGTPTITKTTIDGNMANLGGGIYKQSGSRITIAESTLSNNVAYADGGGVYARIVAVTATNTTFSGNHASDNGGAIYNAPDREFTLINSTLSNNSADNLGGAVFVEGGNVRPKQTIIANSTSGGNCSGAIVSQDYNLSDDGSCNLGAANDLANTAASLAPLGDYGGPTQTHQPFQSSAAVDSGTCITSTDQRGVSRPQGIDCDRGSVEAISPVELSTLCINLYTGNVSSSYSGQCAGSAWQINLPSPYALSFCVNPYTGQLSYARRGRCAPPRTSHVIPDDGGLLVCWSRYTGALRVTPDPLYCNFGAETPALIGSVT